MSYAYKYCGIPARSPSELTGHNCQKRNGKCIPVPDDESHAVCEYCGRTANSVTQLCHISCSASPTGMHIARG